MSDPRPGGSITDGVSRHQLGNGLTVLVKENHTVPVVAMVTYVKAGYFHEDDDVAGISHVIEHMYFNGTPSRPGAEDISRETKGYGGSLNAGTIYDRTSYYVILPSERWLEGLSVQADAFLNPLFDEDVLGREMEAILQEARRKLDNPASFGAEKMFELAFQKHRMRRWRIGKEEVLRAMTRDDIVQYYQDHYRPQNTVLTIVGDVNTAEVLAEVEALYGAQPRGELRKRSGPSESKQTGFRYARQSGDLTRNYMFLGFHTPGVLHADNPALEVLASILSSGRSSRLVGRLKEDLKVVTSVSASVFQFDDVGMFTIDAVTEAQDLDRAARELFVEIERVKQFGVTQAELQKARAALRTSEALAQEEVLGQASALAQYEALGDYELLDEELAALANVSAEDVQRVAREYLQIENASLFEYVAPWAPSAREPAQMAAHLKGAVLAEVHTFATPTAPEPALSYLDRGQLASWSNRFATSHAQESQDVLSFDLPHGGVLLVKQNHAVPTVAVSAYFRGGRIDEFDTISGITQMMQRVMVKETNNRPPKQLAAEIEALGTSIQRVSHDDYFGFSLTSLTENFPAAFDVLFDVIANPRFSPEELSIEREAQMAAIQGIEDQSASLAVQLLRNSLFGEHPYGRPELGSPNLIAYVTADRLQEYHGRIVRPECLVLSVAGDVDADLVHEFVSAYFGTWTPSGEALPATAAAFYAKDRVQTLAPLFDVREGSVEKDRAQTALLVAFPTVPRAHPDVIPLELLQSITGGLGGTFFEEVRSKRGLAYQVSTIDASRALGGYFATFVACSPDTAETVKSLVVDLMQGLAQDPPTGEALLRAQNHLVGSYLIGLQTNRSQAAQLAALQTHGLDLAEFHDYPDRVRAVTLDDLVRVAGDYFDGKPYAVGAVQGRAGSAATP